LRTPKVCPVKLGKAVESIRKWEEECDSDARSDKLLEMIRVAHDDKNACLNLLYDLLEHVSVVKTSWVEKVDEMEEMKEEEESGDEKEEESSDDSKDKGEEKHDEVEKNNKKEHPGDSAEHDRAQPPVKKRKSDA
jgi:hypothetical protein